MQTHQSLDSPSSAGLLNSSKQSCTMALAVSLSGTSSTGKSRSSKAIPSPCGFQGRSPGRQAASVSR